MSALYQDPAIRQRLIEYLGGESLEQATAIYVTHTDGCQFQRSEIHAPEHLGLLMDAGLDLARSLADRESFLFHLDIEYVDFDDPATPFANPGRIFMLQEPVVRVVEQLLLAWGISPLHLITGQGHHFVWRIGLDSRVARRIATLDPDPAVSQACHSRQNADSAFAGIDLGMQELFSASALMMEYLAHRIKWLAAPLSQLPVEITAVHVGAGKSARREIVSIDISEYGDPLHTRMIRMPYTKYLKPWLCGIASQASFQGRQDPFMAIPLFEMNVQEALLCRRDMAAVTELAQRACTLIPRCDSGTTHFLNEYLDSPLHAFHEDYYSATHSSFVYGKSKTGSLPEGLPPCGLDILSWPNDRLLKPAGMQLVTRILLAHGWHPRRIAGLIRGRFENPEHGWGVDWSEYDAATRADFYTRLFAGLWKTRVDELIDFNCTSTREKGFCPESHMVDCSLSLCMKNLNSMSR